MYESLAVTGITGKSGSVFADYLSQNKEKINELFPGGIKLLLHSKKESDKDLLSDFTVEKLYGDLEDASFLNEALAGVDTIVHIAGIHWSREVVTAAGQNYVRRMIAVHTTGIYSKYKEAGEEYRNIDEYVYQTCKAKDIVLTILRPTMIYGSLQDGNVSKFIKMVDKFPIMPVVNGAEYELQPVHYADLGKAYYDVLVNESVTGGHDYILSGGEEIMLKDMLNEMGAYLAKKMRYFSVPFPIAYMGAWAVYGASLTKIDLREKVQRLCEPRIYPHTEASRDFGYAPRGFRKGVGDEVLEYRKQKKDNVKKKLKLNILKDSNSNSDKKMNILVVCQYYYPEPFRIHEVCEELVARGHKVTVLTGLPNYPMGIIPDEYKNGQHRDEYVNGVHIIRVNEIPRGKGKVALAKNYVSYAFNGSMKALSMKKDFDVIFVYQLSPILMAIPAYVAKWFSKTKNISIYCLDLWPESLTSLGIQKQSAFYRFMKLVSVLIYKGSYNIAVTSRMFHKYFKEELKVTKKDFTHIPQFADDLFADISEDSDEALFLNEEKMEKDTIDYVFAGNIGEMQSVDTIIRAASKVKDKRIRWHIVGDGSKYEELRRLTYDLKVMDRVMFYGRLPVEAMPEFYSMADAMIVTLAKNKTISYTLPGKIQSYMAAGKPVLAAAMGETKKVIEKAECGMCAKAEDADDFARIADEMAGCSRLKEYGANSRKYYDEHFSKKSHIDKIEAMLRRACR